MSKMGTEDEINLRDAVVALESRVAELIAADNIRPAQKAKLQTAHQALDNYLNPESEAFESLKALSTALTTLIEGTDWQVLRASMLAFFSGLFAFSANANVVPLLPLNESQKSILLNLPALTAMYSRLQLGINASKTGGREMVSRFLMLSSVGLALTTLMAWMTTSGEMSHSSTIFSVGVVAATMAGFGFASVSTVPTASGWFHKNKSGMVSALIAGLGGITPGLLDFLFSFISSRSHQNIGLLVLNGLLLASIQIIQSESLGLSPTPYQQLMNTYGLPPETARILASKGCDQELFSNENVSWRDYGKLLSNKAAWLHVGSYAKFFGSFIGLTALLRLILQAWDYSAAEARLYSSVFSLSSSFARTLTGVPQKYFNPSAYFTETDPESPLQKSALDNDTRYGATVNMAGALLMTVGCVALASASPAAVSNPMTFLPILLGTATGIGYCCAAILKRISKDDAVDFYTTTSLTASIGPLGSFLYVLNGNLFLSYDGDDKGVAYQHSFSVYGALSLAVGVAYMYWGPREEENDETTSHQVKNRYSSFQPQDASHDDAAPPEDSTGRWLALQTLEQSGRSGLNL